MNDGKSEKCRLKKPVAYLLFPSMIGTSRFVVVARKKFPRIFSVETLNCFKGIMVDQIWAIQENTGVAITSLQHHSFIRILYLGATSQ